MWRNVSIVFWKEIIDNARDRRSLLVAFIYPLMGPVLLGLLISAVVGVVTAKPTAETKLAISGLEHAPQLAAFLKQKGIIAIPAPADPATAVRKGAVESVLIVSEEFSDRFKAERTATLSVVVNSSRLPGLLALNRIAGILGEFNREVWEERFASRGIDHRVIQPLAIKSINVAEGEHIAEFLLFMVPPLFIFNLFMGGVYLAIDVTSGERERGSLEPLLINPIERWGLMLGKYGSALFFTAAAVLVQLIAFRLVFEIVEAPDLGFTRTLSLVNIIGIFIITLPLMMLAVGVQVVIATITRSLKEAQTYLGLLPLVPAIPGLVMVFAPVQVQDWMMPIPVFSQTLLLGQIVRGEGVELVNVAVSMGTSTAIAALLILLTARMFDREKFIFGG